MKSYESIYNHDVIGLEVVTEFHGKGIITNAWLDGRIIIKLDNGDFKYDFIEYVTIVKKINEIQRMVNVALSVFNITCEASLHTAANKVLNAVRSPMKTSGKRKTNVAYIGKVKKAIKEMGIINVHN